MTPKTRHARDGEQAARTHHIDAIAHHFLSVPGADEPDPAPASVRDLAIAASGSGRAAACVAAGLAAASRSRGWGACLVEDEAVAWSALSWLGGAAPSPLPPALGADLPAGVRARWLGPSGTHEPLPTRWLRWRLLGEATPALLTAWEVVSGLPAAARAAAPHWETLVWCTGVHEAALPAATAALERLVALLNPAHLEFLVVPEAWDARPGAWRLAGRRADPGWRNLAHLQELARIAAGPRPATVRLFPDAPATADGAAGEILGEIVAAATGSRGRRAAG